jgi:hypothetical protein
MFISCSVLIRKTIFFDQSYGENQNTHFMSSKFFLENHAIHEMWKNIVEADRSQMTI